MHATLQHENSLTNLQNGLQSGGGTHSNIKHRIRWDNRRRQTAVAIYLHHNEARVCPIYSTSDMPGTTRVMFMQRARSLEGLTMSQEEELDKTRMENFDEFL